MVKVQSQKVKWRPTRIGDDLCQAQRLEHTIVKYVRTIIILVGICVCLHGSQLQCHQRNVSVFLMSIIQYTINKFELR